jgi:hypothetical protein
MNAPNFLINDRLSFMRFLGLGLQDRVPDARTIWLIREKLTTAGALPRRRNQAGIDDLTRHSEVTSLPQHGIELLEQSTQYGRREEGDQGGPYTAELPGCRPSAASSRGTPMSPKQWITCSNAGMRLT